MKLKSFFEVKEICNFCEFQMYSDHIYLSFPTHPVSLPTQLYLFFLKPSRPVYAAQIFLNV